MSTEDKDQQDDIPEHSKLRTGTHQDVQDMKDAAPAKKGQTAIHLTNPEITKTTRIDHSATIAKLGYKQVKGKRTA